MKANVVAHPDTAADGRQRIDWVARHMPVLSMLRDEFSNTQPFAGLRVVVCVHLEAKTAYLAEVLHAGGAAVAVTGSNPDSTKDNVVAALAEAGLHVYARHGASETDMRQYMEMALEIGPHIVIDDGGDLVEILHDQRPELARDLLGVCEETTTGVERAIQRNSRGELRFPVVLINNAQCKYLFDNVHGTGQSVWDAIMRSTNVSVAGKVAVIVGYGWCGRGLADRARGLGARVIVTEIDPIRALDAHMAGFEVTQLRAAIGRADFLVTATGVTGAVGEADLHAAKDGILLANAGHFWDEIDLPSLQAAALEQRTFREHINGFRLPEGWVYLLGGGHIANIACADGHPADIMDMSFALQAMCALHLATSEKLDAGVHPVPADVDRQVARRKLDALDIAIDRDRKQM